MKIINDSMKELRESMKALQMQDPMKELRASMKALQLQDPMKELRASMKALQLNDPMRELRNSFKAFHTQNSLRNILETISANNWALSYEDRSDLQFTADGIISIEQDSISCQQLQEMVSQVVSSSFSDSTLRLEQKIDLLIREISSLKEPFLQKILAWLIYPLIVGLILSVVAPVTDYYIKYMLHSGDKRLLVKNVRKTITRTMQDKSYLSSFKIVAASTLNVRKSGSNKSEVVGLLYFGDIVEVVEKGRKWSLVSCHDNESNVLLQGWVFSRYLKVIR